MLYKKINVELIVIADEADAVIGKLNAELDRLEETLDLLEQGYKERSPLLLFIQTDPAFDFLHGEPRYRTLIQDMGLPPTY